MESALEARVYLDGKMEKDDQAYCSQESLIKIIKYLNTSNQLIHVV